MADYTISFTAAEDAVLQKLVALTGKTAQLIIDQFGKTAIKEQALQYIQEQAINKVKAMTVAQQIAFLAG